MRWVAWYVRVTAPKPRLLPTSPRLRSLLRAGSYRCLVERTPEHAESSGFGGSCQTEPCGGGGGRGQCGPVLPSFLCADLEVCCLQGSPCPRGELSGGRHGCPSSFAFVACCTATVCARVCSNTANALSSYWGCRLASQKLLFIFVFQFLFSLAFSLSLSSFTHSFKVNL